MESSQFQQVTAPQNLEAEKSVLGGLLPVSYTHLTLPTKA